MESCSPFNINAGKSNYILTFINKYVNNLDCKVSMLMYKYATKGVFGENNSKKSFFC